IEELRHYFMKIPLLPGSIEVLNFLHEKRWKIALISSGLPQIFVEELAVKFKVDYAFGLKLKIDKGRFTGEIEGEVLRKNGKETILKRILHSEGLSPQSCILVADDRNNLQMFKYAGLKIGYNPDFMLSAKSDYVVIEDLTKILPIIAQNRFERTHVSLTRESLIRETIHTAGFFTSFFCIYILNRYITALLIFLVTVLYTASEFARISGKTFPIFTLITSKAAVKLEQYEFATAPIFYAFGIIISLLIFTPSISYASIAILTLGDGAAALFGRKFGKTQFPFNKAKHLEGTILGLIFAFVGASIFLNPTKAFIGAVVGTSVECLPTPVSDNIAVPLISGVILTFI
ncbi:haloacid dehalogenase-like hydrolase, partial [Candidatus Bathyarchaeota archaeon]|nr:haloacid dehalogenase-like hydrolase [Candidatus Bathyarchaeota archaeon]